MTYRDDLDAAHARAADLERQIVALEQRQVGIEPRRRSAVGPVISVVAGLGLALGAVLGHLGWLVAIGGVLVALTAASTLQSAAPSDAGPHPIRQIVEAPSADDDVRLLVICLVRVVPQAPAAAVFTTANRERIGDTVREVVEGVTRGLVATRTAAELRAATELSAAVHEGVGAALDRYGLVVDSLYVSMLR